MNRRGFVKTLFAATPALLLPKALDAFRWKKRAASDSLWVPNPAWVDAEYELVFYSVPDLSAIYLDGEPKKQVLIARPKPCSVISI